MIGDCRLHIRDPRCGGMPGITSIGRSRAGRVDALTYDSVGCVGQRQGNVVVDGIDFRRSEGWIQGQAEVGACSFHVGGNCECAANYRTATHHCGSPRETDARLEVPPAIEAIIERPAGSVLAGQIDVSGGEIVVGLIVIGFNPWRVCIVAEAKVQGKLIRHAPCVFAIDADDVTRLLPCVAGTGTTPNRLGAGRAQNPLHRRQLRCRQTRNWLR